MEIVEVVDDAGCMPTRLQKCRMTEMRYTIAPKCRKRQHYVGKVCNYTMLYNRLGKYVVSTDTTRENILGRTGSGSTWLSIKLFKDKVVTITHIALRKILITIQRCSWVCCNFLAAQKPFIETKRMHDSRWSWRESNPRPVLCRTGPAQLARPYRASFLPIFWDKARALPHLLNSL